MVLSIKSFPKWFSFLPHNRAPIMWKIHAAQSSSTQKILAPHLVAIRSILMWTWRQTRARTMKELVRTYLWSNWSWYCWSLKSRMGSTKTCRCETGGTQIKSTAQHAVDSWCFLMPAIMSCYHFCFRKPTSHIQTVTAVDFLPAWWSMGYWVPGARIKTLDIRNSPCRSVVFPGYPVHFLCTLYQPITVL